MKFLIDENISPEVSNIIKDYGYTAFHVNELKSKNDQRISDDQIRHYTLHKNFILISKDDDFVKSFISRKVPEKLVFLFNLNENRLLVNRIKDLCSLLPEVLKAHDFIEINPLEIRTPLS